MNKNRKKELKKFEDYLKCIINAIIINDSKSVCINGHKIILNKSGSFQVTSPSGEILNEADTTLFFISVSGVRYE